jgi:ATP/maltotriose-dependent transcriptional regulator MalT
VYEELRAGLGSYPVDYRWGAVLVHLADLAVEFGDGPTAEVVAAGLRAVVVCPGTSGTATAYFVGSADRFLGRLAALTGRLEEAEALLRGAVEVDIGLRARPHVVLARLDLAGVLHRRGALQEAATLARLAAAEARRLDMPGPLATADRLAAAVDGARRHADPLTARERQVADLVVQARSNRDIAQELVLSERTVESHVRNILAKLQLANRTELIARGR